jgi:hypothetical protein
MAVVVKIFIFWAVTPRILVECYKLFGGSALEVEAAVSSKMLAVFFQTTWRYIQEDSNLQKHES